MAIPTTIQHGPLANHSEAPSAGTHPCSCGDDVNCDMTIPPPGDGAFLAQQLSRAHSCHSEDVPANCSITRRRSVKQRTRCTSADSHITNHQGLQATNSSSMNGTKIGKHMTSPEGMCVLACRRSSCEQLLHCASQALKACTPAAHRTEQPTAHSMHAPQHLSHQKTHMLC